MIGLQRGKTLLFCGILFLALKNEPTNNYNIRYTTPVKAAVKPIIKITIPKTWLEKIDLFTNESPIMSSILTLIILITIYYTIKYTWILIK